MEKNLISSLNDLKEKSSDSGTDIFGHRMDISSVPFDITRGEMQVLLNTLLSLTEENQRLYAELNRIENKFNYLTL